MYKIFENVLNSSKIDKPFIAISSAWFAYTVQSLISINQIGLAIWGWLLTGAVIAFEISTPNRILDKHLKHISLLEGNIQVKYQKSFRHPHLPETCHILMQSLP